MSNPRQFIHNILTQEKARRLKDPWPKQRLGFLSEMQKGQIWGMSGKTGYEILEEHDKELALIDEAIEWVKTQE